MEERHQDTKQKPLHTEWLREGTAANHREEPEALCARVEQHLERLAAAVVSLTEYQHQLLTILEEFCALHLTQSPQEQERAAALRQTFVRTQALFAARPQQPVPMREGE